MFTKKISLIYTTRKEICVIYPKYRKIEKNSKEWCQKKANYQRYKSCRVINAFITPVGEDFASPNGP